MSRRGENIYKRKDGRWEGRYIKYYMDGKAKYGYIYAKSYKEVKEKVHIAIKNNEKTEKPKRRKTALQQDMNFITAAEVWLEFMKGRLKDSSMVKYRNVLTAYLFPRFGNFPVAEIEREDILAFSNELLLSGGRRGKGLAPGTVMGILSVLKGIFIYVARWKGVPTPDIHRLPVRQERPAMRILSLSEQRRLNRYLCEELTPTNLGILVCLYTGLRIGEICAMKWEDISFEEHCLYVNKTMQRIQNRENQTQKTTVLISAPKSECSIRKIPIPDEIFRLIDSARHTGKAYFLTGSDTFVEPRTMQNRFKSVIRKCHVKDANFHALRHTFATRCVELGFDIKSLSEILGHASVNITLNRYVHPSMELKKKNMNLLSELLSVK